MKKTFKTAVILMVMLALALLSAFCVSASDGACYIGDNTGTTYGTLSEAITAAQEGNTVNLTGDVDFGNAETADITYGKSFTVEGNGHTVTMKSNMKLMHATNVVFQNVTFKLGGKYFWVVEPESTKTTKLTLGENCVLDGEEIKRTSSSGGNENGGAIKMGNYAQVVMESGSVIQNCAAHAGGAVAIENGSFTFKAGAKITNCHSSGEAGAFKLFNDGSKLVLLGGTIENCSTTGTAGGAIKAEKGTVELSGDATVTGNTAGETNPVANNIWVGNATQLKLTGNFTGSAGVTVSGAQAGFAFGTAESGALGAENIYCDGNSALAGLAENGTLYFFKDGEAYVGTDKYNRSSLNEVLSTAAAGSIIHLTKNAAFGESGGGNKTIASVTIDGENPGGDNFAITLYQTMQIMHKDVTLKNVTVKLNGKQIWLVEHDNDAAKVTRLTLDGGTVLDGENNKAQSLGGAIKLEKKYAASTAEVIMKSGSVIKNCASTNMGGAAFINGGTFTMESGSTIENCTADNNAGAIKINYNADYVAGKLELKGGTIKNCVATPAKCGGAVHATAGTVELSGNPTVTENLSGSAKSNIHLTDANQLRIVGNFTGSVSVTISGNAAGVAFGTAESGALGAENIYCDEDSALAGLAENGTLYFFKDGEAYVGTDKYNRSSLNEVLSTAVAGSIIHLTKNAAFGESGGGNKTIASVTIDGENPGGDNFAITLYQTMQIMHKDVTLKNVTVKLNGNVIWVVEGESTKTSKLTLASGAVLDGENKQRNSNAGAIEVTQTAGTTEAVMESGSVIKNCVAKNDGGAIFVNGGTVTVKSGATISNCKSAEGRGGAICLKSDAATANKLVLLGGTIESCSADLGGGAIYAAKGNVELSGNTKVSGCKVGAANNNIQLYSSDQLELKDGFTGSVSVTISGAGEGVTFGTAASGITGVKSIESIKSDSSADLFGWVNSSGQLVWQATPKAALSVLDSGIYTDGDNNKAVIRLLTVFNNVSGCAKVTGFGTYALTGAVSDDKSSHLSLGTKFYKNAAENVTKDSGYTVDVYTGAQTSINAVSFFYIDGVTDPVFSAVKSASANQENVLEASVASEKRSESGYYQSSDSLQ